MSDSPSAQLIAKASQEFDVKDSTGRLFKLKKPGLLAQFRLVECIGDLAKNEVYFNMCRPLIYVAAIDGDPVLQPTSKLQLDALIQRVEDDGLKAIVDGIVEHFGMPDPEADKDAIKK